MKGRRGMLTQSIFTVAVSQFQNVCVFCACVCVCVAVTDSGDSEGRRKQGGCVWQSDRYKDKALHLAHTATTEEQCCRCWGGEYSTRSFLRLHANTKIHRLCYCWAARCHTIQQIFNANVCLWTIWMCTFKLNEYQKQTKRGPAYVCGIPFCIYCVLVSHAGKPHTPTLPLSLPHTHTHTLKHINLQKPQAKQSFAINNHKRGLTGL